MTHYLHHDDEAKQDAQMKRIKRRAKYARQATGKWAFVRMKQPGLSEIRRSRDPAADLAPFGSQQASQHPRASEGELQMQLVEAPHDREVGARHRTGQIINAAAADL